MMSPYHLLNNDVVGKDNLEARRILMAAEEVVDIFYDDLGRATQKRETYLTPFLLVSFDKVTFGDPAIIHERHMSATATGSAGTFLAFPDELTAEEVQGAFSRDEDEVRMALMMLLINLRQVWDEGASRTTKRQVQQSFNRLKGMLEYSLAAYLAN